ncbi:MAG: dihydrolipoyl dehydrogenase [Pseudomonadota bacterium]
MSTFDLVVVGGGPGGYVAAIRGAQLGMRVAIVEERATLGGTCLNVGCIPSKALLQSSHLFHQVAHEAAVHGVVVAPPRLDLGAMMARKQAVVDEVVGGLGLLMRKHRIQVFRGTGSLEGGQRVAVALAAGGQEELTGRFVILATGSEPVELPFLRFDGERVVSSTEALSFEQVPQRLAVVGGGAIGLELGSVWLRLGAQVTVLEMLPAIAPFADTMASRTLQRSLKQQGMVIELQARVTGAREGAAGFELLWQDKKGREQALACDKVLVAVGRRPRTAGLEPGRAGLALDERGRIAVDEGWQTNLPGVFAIGDVVPGAMLAHKAEEEAVALVERLAGRSGHVDPDAIPSVVYTEPELASVGLTEEQAKERGHEVKVGRFYFQANARAKALGRDEGLVKLVADATSGRLLGAHMVGPGVSELIHETCICISLGARAEDLARTCHAHPTLSEAVKEAALAVDGRSIHGG